MKISHKHIGIQKTKYIKHFSLCVYCGKRIVKDIIYIKYVWTDF
jgi:hypothetical protein